MLNGSTTDRHALILASIGYFVPVALVVLAMAFWPVLLGWAFMVLLTLLGLAGLFALVVAVVCKIAGSLWR